jgi:LDH2 family malate/lactate/ureidoglycolate dehydrogenase
VTGDRVGPILVGSAELKPFVREIFVRKGLTRDGAATVADALVWANLRGVDSHGVSRVPRYLEMIEAGELNPRPEITTRNESAAAVLIEADRAAGPIAMTLAMKLALAKAKDVGIGLALVRATTHTAALAYYALMAAREGVAAIATAGSVPNMVYHGTRAAGVSTSPLCIAVPGGAAGPVVLDMGSGMVSLGRLAQARRQGGPIPEDWALDADGNRTTDPARAEIPLPMAGPKGSGLALMVECLTSLLVANPVLADAVGRPGKPRHRQNGLAIAIDVGRFGDPAAFAAEVDRLAQTLKNLPREPDAAEILMPGERAARAYQTRNRDGIPLPRTILDQLNLTAGKLGIPPLL